MLFFVQKKINPKKLKVRNVLPGDRFKPLGMKGSRKIQDIFVDKKIPKLERSSVPIVLNENDIIWIPRDTASQRALKSVIVTIHQ